MRTGVLAIKRNGTIAVINEIAYRILGLRPDGSHIGRPFTDVLEHNEDIAEILASAFQLSYLPNRAELRLRKSGRIIGYTLSRIVAQRGETIGASLFFKDLTRVEQLEERERLRDRLAALGEMAAAIAHEVKNPLAGIQVMAGVLKRHFPDVADAQMILNDIISEAKIANNIVLDVLEFVRPINLQVERVALPEVIRDAIGCSESQADRGEVAVTMRFDPALPPVQGDYTQLRQLFTNLLTNAFEALGGQGRVDISAVYAAADDSGAGEPLEFSGFVVIDLQDDGPGIAADVTEQIFSPFFTTKPSGTGLGLAIVRKIIDAHDGRIDVEATAGAGTRFRITLPVTAASDESRKPHDARDSAARAAE
jgi:two-component system nitrogen regulation sensor histidine kinase GlnL